MAYEKVRDSKLDNKYVEDAAFNAVKSYEMALAELQQKGAYTEPPLPAVGKTQTPVTPMQIPELVQRLQQAYDVFAQRVPGSGRVPTMTYKAAEIPLRYLHWDDARPRMEQIVTKYCKDDIGANAGNAILVTYTIEKNLDKIEEWANRLKAANCGSTLTAQKNAAELGKLSLGVKFQKADALFADKKYEEAAKLYVADRRLAIRTARTPTRRSTTPPSPTRTSSATRRRRGCTSASSTTTRRRSSSTTRSSAPRSATRRRSSSTAPRSRYLRLAEDKRFAASAHRTDALYNAAIILENDQNYAKAADLFKTLRGRQDGQARGRVGGVLPRGVNLEKMKDYDKAIKTFNEYVKTYGNDPKGSERVLEAWFRIAQTRTRRKHDKPRGRGALQEDRGAGRDGGAGVRAGGVSRRTRRSS